MNNIIYNIEEKSKINNLDYILLKMKYFQLMGNKIFMKIIKKKKKKKEKERKRKKKKRKRKRN